jgi:phosphate transport system substrate-binding protein
MTRTLTACLLAATTLSGGAAAQTIRIDGAHILYPLMTDAVRAQPGLVADLDFSSTAEGLDRLCGGEVDIVMADRPMLDEEAGFCAETGVESVELPIALDAVVLVANPADAWLEAMTLDEVERIWAPAAEGTVRLWSDVRPDWPQTALSLYGPPQDAPASAQLAEGLFGEPLGLRADYAAMDDLDLLAQSVSREEGALAFMGFAGLLSHGETVRALALDAGGGPVAPELSSILDGTYPFGRVYLLYVAGSAAARQEVQSFLQPLLAEMPERAVRSGLAPLPDRAYDAVARHLEEGEPTRMLGTDALDPALAGAEP